MQATVIVLDSLGIGAAPDAAEFGDAGSNTLAHLAEAAGGIRLPTLERMGLGNIPAIVPGGLAIAGVPPAAAPTADFGAMREVSRGKDTTTGHWEMAGLELKEGFPVFPKGPPSFPDYLIREFERRTGRRVIGNKAASGTAIIEELGEQQMKDGAWIVYTSADSVFQIAAHEQIIPLQELYRGCDAARELCDGLRVGRVIARPYVGSPGNLTRTKNRRDYSMPPPEETVLDKLVARGVPVAFIGKVDDIFARRGMTESLHSETNAEVQRDVKALLGHGESGLIFANLIDFDMLYGHRRDASGYARALEQADAFIGWVEESMVAGSLLVITADHGNDPTFKGTDHTREFVPLLVYRAGQGRPGRNLGIRRGFFDVAQSLASFFGIPPMPRGRSFLSGRGTEGGFADAEGVRDVR